LVDSKVCQELGWIGKGTHFDVLPIVIQIGNSQPSFFDIPQEIASHGGPPEIIAGCSPGEY